MAATEIADPVREFLAADTHELLIDGERAAAADGATFDTPDPSTGERLATGSQAGAEGVGPAGAAPRPPLAAPSSRAAPGTRCPPPTAAGASPRSRSSSTRTPTSSPSSSRST